ncbi:MAG TPA: tetratricopeptide repeat-containing glycosyltransferase family protein, partial [Phycisphaerae bacterium]
SQESPSTSASADAEDSLRLRLEDSPNNTQLLRQLAANLVSQRKFSEAIRHLRGAIAIRPDDVQALNALGNALVNAKQPEEAISFLQHALRLLPGDVRLHSNLGLAYADCGRFEQAEQSFHAALALDTMSVASHNNLACLHIMLGRHREALTCLEIALILDPKHLGARRNRALAHLALGEFELGWPDYDWCAFGVAQPPDPYPRWNGQPISGKRILLTANQGLGDTLHFIRYAPMLKSLGTHTLLEAPGPLLEVLSGAPGIDEIIPKGDSIPAADLSVPVMALARLFNTTLETIPASVPYLAASPDLIAAWRERLAPLLHHPRKFLVGLCWQGNPHHQWDQFRSLPLSLLEALTQIPNVQFVSLQRGPGIEQIPSFQALTNNALTVPTSGSQSSPRDLADSAAIMSLLDLIITVDTATAHLAGALARPTWVLLSQTADWRWMTGRPDSPWYPSLRLFRQKNAGDWTYPIDQMAGRLRMLGGK